VDASLVLPVPPVPPDASAIDEEPPVPPVPEAPDPLPVGPPLPMIDEPALPPVETVDVGPLPEAPVSVPAPEAPGEPEQASAKGKSTTQVGRPHRASRFRIKGTSISSLSETNRPRRRVAYEKLIGNNDLFNSNDVMAHDLFCVVARDF
jgi:hypothetical protein